MEITNIKIVEQNGIRTYTANITNVKLSLQTDGVILKHLTEDEFKEVVMEDFK